MPPFRLHWRLVFLLGTSFFLSACETSTPEDARPREAEPLGIASLEAIASRTISPAGDPPAVLSNVVALARHASSLLVVDQAEPHLRVFSSRGDLEAVGGRSGEGPGELIRPWRATVRADSLFVVTSERIIVFRLDNFTELGRLPRPTGVVSFHPDCAGERAYAIATVSQIGATKFKQEAVKVTPSGTWEPEDFGGLQPATFSPVGFDLFALQRADTLIFLDPWRKSVVRAGCDGTEYDVSPIGALEEGTRAAVVKGTALTADGAVFFVRVHGSSRDLTRAIVWRPGQPAFTRLIAGDLRLFPVNDHRAWIINDELLPTLYEVSIPELIAVLES